MDFTELKCEKTVSQYNMLPMYLHAPNKWWGHFTNKKSFLFIWELMFFSKSCSVFQVFWTKNFAWGSRMSQNHDSKIAKLWTLRGKAKRAPILMKKRISDFFYENRQNLYGFGQNKLFGRTVNKKNHPLTNKFFLKTF